MISYQLYSSRNFPPLEGTFDMLAAAGFVAVEGFGGLYADAARLTDLSAGLSAAGLTMPTGHFSLEMIETQPDFVIAAAQTLGMQTVYCPYLLPADRPTDGAGWTAFGARLQAAGGPLVKAGLGFGWHNHDFEFVPTPDAVVPMEAILEGGPDLEWEMDVAWVLRGGGNPLDWIARHGRRITATHVKDIAPAGTTAEDGWADVGHGTVDWAGLMPVLRNAGCGVFVLEHDNPADHVRFATRSLAAVKGY